ncbi:chloride channel protein [Thiocapsa sp.]|uniref:chloride channel protein n=1 Tax=Thiocapsa sp. TaxID=2024551 RepID=UPI002C147C87|nr:chloride channel protein [Thiocapsa sp.]HSO83843.1 chloride channel protein [Thiocapsa sp.]
MTTAAVSALMLGALLWFAPMLAFGTVCGAAFAALVAVMAPTPELAPEVFTVAAMGALFAGTVRAPLTGWSPGVPASFRPGP